MATHTSTAEEQPYDRLDCPACGTIFNDLPDADRRLSLMRRKRPGVDLPGGSPSPLDRLGRGRVRRRLGRPPRATQARGSTAPERGGATSSPSDPGVLCRIGGPSRRAAHSIRRLCRLPVGGRPSVPSKNRTRTPDRGLRERHLSMPLCPGQTLPFASLTARRVTPPGHGPSQTQTPGDHWQADRSPGVSMPRKPRWR